MNPTRAAVGTATVIFGLTALFVVTTNEGTPADRALAIAWLGTPLVAAGAIIAYRVATRMRGADFAERLLNLATTDSEEWGHAMMAELASIDGPRERRRFAFGCLLTTVRVGTGRTECVIALGTGLFLGLITLVTSRLLLDGGQTGILVFTIYGPAFVFFLVSLVIARVQRSFRAGLVAGGLTLVSALLFIFVVAVLEASQWWEEAGIYIMDGDAPKEPLTRGRAMLDAASPFFVMFHLLIWASWPVLGAAAGWRKGRRRWDGALPAATAGV